MTPSNSFGTRESLQTQDEATVTRPSPGLIRASRHALLSMIIRAICRGFPWWADTDLGIQCDDAGGRGSHGKRHARKHLAACTAGREDCVLP